MSLTWLEIDRRLSAGNLAPGLVVEPVRVAGSSWLRLSADAGLREAIDPAEALRHNLSLAVGALALDGDRYVVQALLPLATLDERHLEQALALVGHEAARLRRIAASAAASLAVSHDLFPE